jgi:hypothetical protein
VHFGLACGRSSSIAISCCFWLLFETVASNHSERRSCARKSDTYSGDSGTAQHPFDTVKVKMQTSAHLYPKGAVDCFMQTVRSGGIRGLYAGATPSLVANVGENGVLFLCYGRIQVRQCLCRFQ